ncbi:MAG: trypsin-like peptidase domain-containing protein [Oscillospiraceae bacterium]|jgi:hypothetical protein|nr:trypsin-like peptidase domain-containing protein [Oscillospiraceae bacterium]
MGNMHRARAAARRCALCAAALIALSGAVNARYARADGGLSQFTRVRSYDVSVFSDVRPDAWYAEYTAAVYELGLIDGRAPGKFAPDGGLTIAEAVKLAVTVRRVYEGDTGALETGGQWYEPYVAYAREHDMQGTHHPDLNAQVKRSDFAVILASALPDEALTPINRVDDGAIPDVAVGYSYGRAVYALYRAGVLTGTAGDGSFYPGRNISRAEASAIVARMALSETRSELTLLAALSAESLYEACSPAVFYIEIFDANEKKVKSGSGFFVSEGGLAVTNYHVVSGGSAAKIVTRSGESYDVAGIYDYDEARDIALLQVKGEKFDKLERASSSGVRTGETIYTIGSPLGLEGTITQGIISSAARSIDGREYIQIDAAISSGSSGGALLDAYGRAIGITTGTYQGSQNINFAVPIDIVSELDTDGFVDLSSILPDTVYYTGYFPTPDFGAYAGAETYAREVDGDTVSFKYRRSSLPEDLDATLEGYGQLLEQNFFAYMGYFSNAEGYSDAYINSVYGLFVTCGTVTQNGEELVVVSIIGLI